MTMSMTTRQSFFLRARTYQQHITSALTTAMQGLHNLHHVQPNATYL